MIRLPGNIIVLKQSEYVKLKRAVYAKNQEAWHHQARCQVLEMLLLEVKERQERKASV